MFKTKHANTPEHSVAGSSKTTEKLTGAASRTSDVEFGTLSELRRVFGFSRSSAYELAAAGEIKFVRIRKRGCVRGRVLVCFDSVRNFLARCAEADARFRAAERNAE